MRAPVERYADFVTTYTKPTIAVVLVLTALFALGVPMVEQDSDTQQFETDSPAADAQSFIGDNFGIDDDTVANQTTMQVIQRPADGNALSRDALVESLEFQQALLEHPTIAPTLARQQPTNGVANVLALTYLGSQLEPQEPVDMATVARMDPDTQRVLAFLLGFEEPDEQDTIVDLLAMLEEFDGSETADADNTAGADSTATANGFDFDPDEYTEAEIRQFAATMGFGDAERDTVVEAVQLFSADHPPISLDKYPALSNEEQATVAEILSADQLPPEECVAALGGPGGQFQQPSIECSLWAFETMSDEELTGLIQSVLGPDGNDGVLSLLPTSYERGSTTAEASAIYVTQVDDAVIEDGPAGFAAVTEAQLETRAVAEHFPSQYGVFGAGVITDEIDRSLGDSFAIVGPLALLFVVLALTVAYRDLLDIILGVVGIIAVLIWTFGFMGWTGVAFNQLLISVPVLLIGLSIDYAIHVFMRHREQRQEEESDRNLRRSMTRAVAGVGVALVWVTATAAIGFLANLVSPIGPLRDFGIVSAFGVVAALVIFTALIPAAKVELDSVLEGWGLDRQKRAFGTGRSRFGSVLATGAIAARRFPVAVVVLALLVTVGGAVGATQVDTSFNQDDFLADSPPAWTQHLPGGMAPGDYQAKADLAYAQANFQPADSQGSVLVQGDVTNQQVLYWLDATHDDIAQRDTTFEIAGQPDVTTPLTMMQDRRAANQTPAFVQEFDRLAGDDNIPDGEMAPLFGEFRTDTDQALNVIAWDEADEPQALRVIVGIRGDAGIGESAADLRGAGAHLEAESDGQLDVTATGEMVIFDEVESDLMATVVQGLIITIIAVFAFLSLAYRVTGTPASLGIVTLTPVVLAVAWILGTMYLLDIPFNTLTGTITSLTIGLGIAYSIHISARYELELARQGNVWEAMQTTVTGTGGALLGSAATTVGGFGTLALAILPILQQFGIITGLTIIYAFLASVFVLPSMLVLWTRYFGPSGVFPDEEGVPSEERGSIGQTGNPDAPGEPAIEDD